MFWLAPRARFRIYARAADYVQVLSSLVTGRAAAGDAVERLERAISARFGVPHALCMAQGRLGVYLAVKHLIKPGQKVVLSPYTIADVINMVICAGGIPVFADIDRATTNITRDAVERALDGDTGAVMVTHLHGMACDIEAIAALCRSRGLPLIEDGAQAFGATVGGKPVGTFGAVGVFSFGMYKNITAFFGGVVVTADPALDQRMRAELASREHLPTGKLAAKVISALITDIATSPPLFKPLVYWIFRFAYLHDIAWINRFVTVELDTSRKNALPTSYLRRLLPTQARMVLRQLPDIDRHAATRIRYSKLYYEGLRDLPGLIIPPFADDGRYVYNYFPVQYRDRAALVRWAMEHRRDLAVQHLKNCADLPGFAAEYRDCPNARLTAADTILLPNYPAYGEDSVRQTIAVIRRFFAAGSATDARG